MRPHRFAGALCAALALGLTATACADQPEQAEAALLHGRGDGLVRMPSPYSPAETLDRLEAIVEARGATVFARIDHAAAAA